MASAVGINESDDFVTCSVCLCEYDDVIRRPKFLPCSHTICVNCLKVSLSIFLQPAAYSTSLIIFSLSNQGIHSNGAIVCPLCRNLLVYQGDVTGLVIIEC